MLTVSHSNYEPEYEEEKMMKSLFEELGGSYTLGADGTLYPNLTLEPQEHRSIGKWGRMHRAYLEAEHPGLYEQERSTGIWQTQMRGQKK